MPVLSTKSARQKLRKRREPYWMRLHKYCHLGFRRGPEKWIARFTRRDPSRTYSYEYKALEALDFDGAKDAAEAWFSRMGSRAARVVIRGSVRSALETYISCLQEQGRDDTARHAGDRFRLIVWDDVIADMPLEDLSRHDFRAGICPESR